MAVRSGLRVSCPQLALPSRGFDTDCIMQDSNKQSLEAVNSQWITTQGLLSLLSWAS